MKDPLRFYGKILSERKSSVDILFSTSSQVTNELSGDKIYCQFVKCVEEYFSKYEMIRLKLSEYKRNYKNKELDEGAKREIRQLKESRKEEIDKINHIMNDLAESAVKFERLKYKEYNESVVIGKYNNIEKRWEIIRK